MLMRCNNTISLEYRMMIYFIMKKMRVKLGATIRDTMPFPSTIEALCLKAISELLAFLKAHVPSGVCFEAILNRTIMLYQNKAEERRPKTLIKLREKKKRLPAPTTAQEKNGS